MSRPVMAYLLNKAFKAAANVSIDSVSGWVNVKMGFPFNVRDLLKNR